jgi:pimeloyl-ACP methyl ester carboxylesterase
MKDRRWIIKRVCISLGILLASCISFLLIISPGKTNPHKNEKGQLVPNSIATIERPIINGIPQGMIIRGENINNPVLLFLHGGPGMPAYAWIREQFAGMEKHFTICYWEQRGSGMSYSGKIPATSMNLEQFIEDAAEVTQYLIKKFTKKKIFILGHSWGSFLGSFVINKYPQLYHAYIGIGQLGNSYNSERSSLEFVKKEASLRGDKKGIRQLGDIALPSPSSSGKDWWNYYKAQRKYVFKYGGARYQGKWSANDIKEAILFCREYKLGQKLRYAKGLKFSAVNLESSMIKNDLSVALPVQHIPVFIFQGIHDQQTTYAEAKRYFEKLEAPTKRFFTFYNSAHSPHIEEYPVFEELIKKEVLILAN